VGLEELQNALVAKWKHFIDYDTNDRDRKILAMLLENQTNEFSLKNNLKTIFADHWKYGESFVTVLKPGEVRKAWLTCCWCGQMLPDGHASDELYCSLKCAEESEQNDEDAEQEQVQRCLDNGCLCVCHCSNQSEHMEKPARTTCRWCGKLLTDNQTEYCSEKCKCHADTAEDEDLQ